MRRLMVLALVLAPVPIYAAIPASAEPARVTVDPQTAAVMAADSAVNRRA